MYKHVLLYLDKHHICINMFHFKCSKFKKLCLSFIHAFMRVFTYKPYGFGQNPFVN